MINIYFKGVDFENDNQFVKMTNYQVLKKEGRLIEMSVPSNSVIDTWNGQEITVQKTIWDGYYCEFYVDESQLNILTKIEACSYLKIEDTENNVKYNVDLTLNTYLDIQRTPVFNSPDYKIRLSFRTNKTTVNVLSDKTTYSIDTGNTYYSPFKPTITKQTPESERILDNSGVETTTQVSDRLQVSFIFFLNAEDTNSLVFDMSTVTPSLISIVQEDPMVTTYDVLENVDISPELVGINLYKSIVDVVVESEIYYKD